MIKSKEEKLKDIYDETYDEALKYAISKCRNIEYVQDIIQNSYVNFYKAMDKVEIKNYRKYLFKIIKNEIFKTYGVMGIIKNNIPLFSLNEEVNIESEENIDIDSKVLCDDIYDYLKEKDMLTFKIFILYFKFDMKIIDISKKLRISESNVKNRKYYFIEVKGKKYLKEKKSVIDIFKGSGKIALKEEFSWI